MLPENFPSISEHSKKHGLVPKKHLGQNFLFDINICRKIADSHGCINGKNILEIGSGPCGLTRAILEQNPKKLIVIEKDNVAAQIAQDLSNFYSNLYILNKDATKVSIDHILDTFSINKSEKISVIANLPYNIGTGLLVDWFLQLDNIESMTIMLQKEVCERIMSNHGNKDYGRLSVFAQSICDIKKCLDVPREVFSPVPKVDSCVIHLKPKANRIDKNTMELLQKITNLAFGQRRKMIKSSMKSVTLPSYINCLDRAENLSVEDFINIAKYQG